MLELLWRGFTHWSMFVLGGVCYLLVGRVAVWCCGRLPMWFCCATNTLLITVLEFVTGCLVNLHLGWDVWDYATQPLNLMGQVCIGFSALWFLLSVPVSGLSLAMLKSLQKRMVFAKTEG